MLATDSPTYNKNLMDLATEFRVNGESFDINTVAYQAMSGVPIQEDLRALRESELVVFQDRDELNPSFTNQRVEEYERYVRQAGFLPARVGADLTAYSKNCRL
jgi:hypothetical protein